VIQNPDSVARFFPQNILVYKEMAEKFPCSKNAGNFLAFWAVLAKTSWDFLQGIPFP
jgi:hypothetical protein